MAWRLITIVLLLTGNHLMAQEPTPMSCAIKGKIVCVCNSNADDAKSPCSKYPCKAHVQILAVSGCGSSVTQIPNVGDTVEMNFAYTLHRTKKIFPEMKERYPGLKRKRIFTANVTQKLIPGGGVAYTVYGYTKN